VEVEICKKDRGNVEAVEPLFKKALTGFRELFSYLSCKEISSPTMLSRAIAGVVKGKIIFCLPGSTNVCDPAMKNLVLLELGHVVYEANR